MVGLSAILVLWVAMIVVLVILPLVFWLIALVEVARAPEPAFGPPWDNGKNAWLLGLAVSVVLGPLALVVTILWWVQGHAALRNGLPVPKPFWSPHSGPPHPEYPAPPRLPPDQYPDATPDRYPR